MAGNFINKIKDWMTDEVEEDIIEEEMEGFEEEIDVDDELGTHIANLGQTKSTSKIVNIHTAGQMKVVIVEPKKYEEVTSIADQLKQRRAVIVNLENLDDAVVRKSIFDFMNKTDGYDDIILEIHDMDLNGISPIDALNLLYGYQKKMKERF